MDSFINPLLYFIVFLIIVPAVLLLFQSTTDFFQTLGADAATAMLM